MTSCTLHAGRDLLTSVFLTPDRERIEYASAELGLLNFSCKYGFTSQQQAATCLRLATMNESDAVEIYTTINFTRYSVTELGALSAAGWAWSLHGKQT